MAISQISNSLPRTMRRKPSMRTGTSTKSNAKVFGFTVPSLRAWLLPWVRVTVFNFSSAMGRFARHELRSHNVCRTRLARRAIRSSRSAAIAAKPFGDEKRVLQPDKREIANDNIPYRLEYLELMPLRILGPERHRGLKRRTARKAAREFRDQDARCFGELKTLARPRSHPFQCFVVLRALCQRAVLRGSGRHGRRSYSNLLPAIRPIGPRWPT